MAILRRDDNFQLATGEAISGAQVYYLTQPANLSSLTPLANVYSDTIGTPSVNPQITDGFGHVGCYLSNAEAYTVVYFTPYLGQTVFPDQTVGTTGAAGFTPFAEVPAGVVNGTNTVFTLSYIPAPGSLLFQLNGLPLTAGLGYVLNGKTVTLATAPQSGDSINANYSY